MEKLLEEEAVVNKNQTNRWHRLERVAGLEEYRKLRQNGSTQRVAAKKIWHPTLDASGLDEMGRYLRLSSGNDCFF